MSDVPAAGPSYSEHARSGSTPWSATMKFSAPWTSIRSAWSARLWARLVIPTMLIDTTAARMPRIEITMSVSISVNPSCPRSRCASEGSALARTQPETRLRNRGTLSHDAVVVAGVDVVEVLGVQVRRVQSHRRAGAGGRLVARRELLHVRVAWIGPAQSAHVHLLLGRHRVQGHLYGLPLRVVRVLLGQAGDPDHAHGHDRGQDAQDRDDDQHLDQGEALLVPPPLAQLAHQSVHRRVSFSVLPFALSLGSSDVFGWRPHRPTPPGGCQPKMSAIPTPTAAQTTTMNAISVSSR